MARLKGRDHLGDVKGRLSADFRSACLTSLHLKFFMIDDTDRKKATQALDHFYRIASKLCIRENDFNKRARPAVGTPSLMTHLRSPAHFEALREFNAVKETLLDINPSIGQSIIRLVERDISVSARHSAPSGLSL